MGREAVGGGRQSLGELIAALRPGDPCPCCSARLQSGLALRQVGGAVASSDFKECLLDKHEAVLCCPECGCEVFLADESTRTCSRRSLGTAA
jgi:hypothetical protein